jgi:hypothetical protein
VSLVAKAGGMRTALLIRQTIPRRAIQRFWPWGPLGTGTAKVGFGRNKGYGDQEQDQEMIGRETVHGGTLPPAQPPINPA